MATLVDFVQRLLYENFHSVADHFRDCAPEQRRDDINHDVPDPVRQQVATEPHVNVSDRLHLKVLREEKRIEWGNNPLVS